MVASVARYSSTVSESTFSLFFKMVFFLSGVAYANEGTIKKVALSTYIITPYQTLQLIE